MPAGWVLSLNGKASKKDQKGIVSVAVQASIGELTTKARSLRYRPQEDTDHYSHVASGLSSEFQGRLNAHGT